MNNCTNPDHFQNPTVADDAEGHGRFVWSDATVKSEVEQLADDTEGHRPFAWSDAMVKSEVEELADEAADQ